MKKLISLIILSITAAVVVTGCGAGGGAGASIDGDINSSAVDKQLSKSNISDSLTDSAKPAIAANSSGAVFIAWEETSGSSTKDINLASSSTSGTTFSLKKGLNKLYCSNSLPVSGDISLTAGENGTLYLAWIEKLLNNARVRFFSYPYCSTISDTTIKNASSAQVNLNKNGDVSVVWADTEGSARELYYKLASSGGSSFSNQLNISNTPYSDSSEPLVAIEGSFNVKAVWVEGETGNRDVVFSKSIDSSREFLPLKIVSSESNDSYCPVIAESLNGTYLAYKGGDKVFFSLWSPITLSFTDPLDISPGPVSPSCPAIALGSDGTIYVAWSDKNSIWLTASHDGGLTFFDTPKEISSPEATSTSPKIAVIGSRIAVVWEGHAGSSKDIYLSDSEDMGNTFSPPKNLSNSPGVPSLSPVIASDTKQFIYVAWEEGQEGSREIFFLKYPM